MRARAGRNNNASAASRYIPPSARGGGGGGDSYVHMRHERAPGVGQKVTNSLMGLFLGPVLIFFGCWLLWSNEGWAIKTHRSLNEALNAYVEIPPTDREETNNKNKYNENQLVHISDKLSVDGSGAIDEEFGLVRNEAISLTRQVELYQWVETHKTERRKLNNGETEVRDIYDYHKKWVQSIVNSQNFHHPKYHENVGELPMTSKTFRVPQGNVRVGNMYHVDNILLQQLKTTSTVPISEVQKIPQGGQLLKGGEYIYLPYYGGSSGGMANQDAALPSGGGDTGAAASTGDEEQEATMMIDKKVITIDGEDQIVYVVKSTGATFSTRQRALEEAAAVAPPIEQQQQQQRRRRDNAISLGSDDSSPQIGDVRIRFTEVRCTTVSILGMLTSSNNLLTSWRSRQGPGYDVGILVPGHVTAADMIAGAQTSNNIFTWIKRAGGFVLNFIGFSMITQIVTTTADITLNWIPLLGPMATSIVGLGVFLANSVLATSTSFLVAAVAWVWYRPFLGIALLVGSLGLFYVASQAGAKKAGNKGQSKLY